MSNSDLMLNADVLAHTLIGKYIAGEISDSEAETLDALLSENPALDQECYENVWLDFFLRERYSLDTTDLIRDVEPCRKEGAEPDWDELVRLQNAELPVREIVRQYQEEQRRKIANSRLVLQILRFGKKCFLPGRNDWMTSPAPWITLLGVITILIMVGSFWLEHAFNGDLEERIETIARVNETIDAVWEEGAEQYRPGQLVDRSLFNLKSGFVELEMNNGTTLILEGPMSLSVRSPMNAFCQSGRVSVHVSKIASGYTVSTPFGRVVDRGTEFFVDAGKNNLQVELIQGRASLLVSDRNPVALAKNEVLEIGRDKNARTRPSPGSRKYVSRSQIQSLARKEAERVQLVKERSVEKILPDQSLIARFDFTNMTYRSVENEAETGRNIVQFASIESAKKTRGRLSGTRAIAIRDPKDMVRAELPVLCDNLTVDLVARIRHLKQEGNLLFASEVQSDGRRNIQIQMQHDGKIQIRLRDPNGDFEFYETGNELTPRMLGTWIHYTFVLDSESHKILFYLDGRQVSVQKWSNPFPVYLGESTIGNAQPEMGSLTHPALDGAIAGFTLWQRALSPGEIATLMLD